MVLYEISKAAEKDWSGITEYTLDRHGEAQTRKYMQGLKKCAEKMAKGEGHYKDMDELYPDMRLKHCQHHYIFGVMRNKAPMLVVAILHERMNLIARIKKRLKQQI